MTDEAIGEKGRGVRIALGILTAFISLTAVGGGVAMLAGADEFPLEWLRGTPFDDYTIPALVLAIVVGGSALAALVSVIADTGMSSLFTMVAGLVMVGYIIVEVLLLNQIPPGPTLIETSYFVIGGAVFGLGLYSKREEKREEGAERAQS